MTPTRGLPGLPPRSACHASFANPQNRSADQ
jgi:hypothetical protein